MARKSKAKFTMKGHTLPGINQKSDVNLKDGRSPSSAFQQKTATVDGTTYDGMGDESHHVGCNETLLVHSLSTVSPVLDYQAQMN